MTLVHACAKALQTLGDRAQLQVGAGDLVAKIQQDLGDAAHPDAANPRKMKLLGLKKHFYLVLFRLSSEVSI
jgi:hypothetical protein